MQEGPMSTFALSPTAPSRSWMDAESGGFFFQFRSGIREGQNIARRYDRLSRMTESELAQHGLTRRDVNRAALMGF
jgi:hypothetical protein